MRDLPRPRSMPLPQRRRSFGRAAARFGCSSDAARAVVALALVLASCSRASAESVVVQPHSGAGIPVAVEIAATPQSRELGLMYRDSLAPDSGMLFVFPERAPQSFWMRNTKIPLDILFVDEDGRIVRIHRRTEPFSEKSLPSGAPIRFVLEVEGGFSERHGVTEGDRIDLGALAKTPSS